MKNLMFFSKTDKINFENYNQKKKKLLTPDKNTTIHFYAYKLNIN